jgi:hypothetical protein
MRTKVDVPRIYLHENRREHDPHAPSAACHIRVRDVHDAQAFSLAAPTRRLQLVGHRLDDDRNKI